MGMVWVGFGFRAELEEFNETHKNDFPHKRTRYIRKGKQLLLFVKQ